MAVCSRGNCENSEMFAKADVSVKTFGRNKSNVDMVFFMIRSV